MSESFTEVALSCFLKLSTFTSDTFSLTISAISEALSFASLTALDIYLLTISTLPSAFVISIVTFVTTAATTTKANIGGIITAITVAAIPALTGTSTIVFPSLDTFILDILPFFIKSFSQTLSSDIVSALLKVSLLLSELSPLLFSSLVFSSIRIIASKTFPL